MSYDCKILKDSVSPDGIRLTTFEITFPRFILAEVNTHRILSKNSASSRAIPTEKMIERVLTNPFVPEFNQRVKGMGVGEALDDDHQRQAADLWLRARDTSVDIARQLLHVDKSRVNRLLEPWLWHTCIISGTEWDNFFALRAHPDAQGEFQIIASMMKAFYESFQPTEVAWGDWHLPLVDEDELDNQPIGFWLGVSAGRCARVSYDRHNDGEDPQASWDRADKLIKAGHMSPMEHQGTPFQVKDATRKWPYGWSGNFFGWQQYRKQLPYEFNFAERLAAA